MSHNAGASEPIGKNPLERIAVFGVHVAAIILQIAAVALVINAVYRYTLGGGFAIISEMTRYSLLVVVFLGLAGTHIVGGLVKVELLLAALPSRVRDLVAGYLVPVASIFYLGLLGWAGWAVTLQMFRHGTTNPTQPYFILWPFASVVPIGCGLLILILLLHLLRRIARTKASDPNLQN